MSLQFCCSCSRAPCAATKSWPAPPPRPPRSQQQALLTRDRLGVLSPLRASPRAKRAKRRTRKKTKRVCKDILIHILHPFSYKIKASVWIIVSVGHRRRGWKPGGPAVYGPGQSAQQVCRQRDAYPVLTLLPVGVELVCRALAGSRSGLTHLQVNTLH